MGCHFLHEHPASADSWAADVMTGLVSRQGVQSRVGRMCRHGVELPTPDGQKRLIRKPTRGGSSAHAVLQSVALRCTNEGAQPG